MPDLATNLLLSVAVFAGAFVSGLAGFAFSAVAGAILLRIFQPMEAVPLMMACSIGVQAANLWALRRNIQWEGSLLLIVGGALGIPIAVYLLQNMDTHFLRIGFGVIVVLYAGYMLFRPALARFKGTDSRRFTALIGFGGGLMGGLTAMPGAIPTIWCDMRGMPKSDQRGLVQPFIAHAGAGAGAAARAPEPVFQTRHRLRDQPAGALRGFPARHSCIPEHQRGWLSPDHSCAIAVVRRFARLGVIFVISAEDWRGHIIHSVWPKES